MPGGLTTAVGGRGRHTFGSFVQRNVVRCSAERRFADWRLLLLRVRRFTTISFSRSRRVAGRGLAVVRSLPSAAKRAAVPLLFVKHGFLLYFCGVVLWRIRHYRYRRFPLSPAPFPTVQFLLRDKTFWRCWLSGFAHGRTVCCVLCNGGLRRCFFARACCVSRCPDYTMQDGLRDIAFERWCFSVASPSLYWLNVNGETYCGWDATPGRRCAVVGGTQPLHRRSLFGA